MKSKPIILIVLVAMLFMLGLSNAKAETIKRFNDEEPEIVEGGDVSVSCGGVFTQDAIDLIKEVLGYFRILAPAVLIVMIGVDLVTAVISMEYMPGKDDSMRKAMSKIFLRVIAAILLFFIPTILNIILGLDGVKDKLVISEDCNDFYK
jgi:hypothetical protein